MRRLLRLAPAWGAGLLWGAFVPAVIFASWARTPSLLPITLGITIVHAFGLGLPGALFFWWRRWTSLAAVAAAGFAVGALPMGLLVWPDETRLIPNSLMVAAGFGLLGASGASAFWLVLRACGALSPAGPHSMRPGALLASLGFCAVFSCFVLL